MDGVSIRSAADEDINRLRRFLAGLSADTTHRRFFTGLGSVSDRSLLPLLRRDDRRDVLLALSGDEVVAHGMCTAVAGRPDVAELAVVVADAWQHRGLGPLLARQLLTAARRRGVRHVGMTVLADNYAALRLVKRAWPRVRPVREHGLCEYLVPLAHQAAA
jgi:ribosomal protein S18 acetylase RimI-like enzyme